MKLLFLTLNPQEIYSVPYRCLIYQDMLLKNRITPTYCPIYPDSEREKYAIRGEKWLELFDKVILPIRRIKEIIGSNYYDIVVLQRSLLPGGFPLVDRLLRQCAKRLIYDFDDAIFIHPKHLREKDGLDTNWLLREQQKIPLDIKLADVVIAGNKYLATYAKKYNRNVTIIPTPVDVSLFRPLPRKENPVPVIGWIGSPSNLYYLYQIIPVFKKIAEKYPCVLKLICSEKPKINSLNFIWEKWDPIKEVQSLNTFDIGISPIINDPWVKGKCGLKLIKYMAVGKPTVSSAVGVHKEIIRHGENGLLAKNNEEFFQNLRLLILNRTLQKKLGQKARKTVLEKYSHQICGNQFIKVLQGLVSV